MIVINIDGRELVQAGLDSLKKALQDPEILSEAGGIALQNIRKRFHAQVSPDGTPWKPSKAALRNNRATLYDTGKLFRSLQLARMGRNTIAIGTNVPYARKHQFGEDGMPVRKFLGLSDIDKSLMQKLIIKRINERVTGG